MPGDNPPSAPRVTTPNQQSGKTAMSGRISGKQEDDSQKRSQPPPKAWGSGVNPITQRSNTPSQANGATNRSSTKTGANNTLAVASMDKVSDRHTQVLSHAMGLPCTFTTKEGGAFVGIPISCKSKQADIQFTFQNVRLAENSDFDRPQKHVAKPKPAGDGAQRTMSVASSQIAFILASEAAGSTRPAQGKGFMTDTEISGNAPARERKLERWQAPSDSTATFGETSNSGEFDQFKVNEQKFGVKSTYNEEDYTTRIDRSSAGFAERNARAARIAAEIEGNSKSNAWTEQRGANDEGYDEEDLYSGVRRDATPLPSGQANRYVPPSRRSQQGTPSEVNNDPAILSAQLAVPKTSAAAEKPSQTSDAPTASKSAQAAGKTAAPPKAIPGALASGKPAAPATLLTQPTTEASKAPAAVVSAFKQFANLEKMKVQNNKHMKNQQDKAVKVNDLKKFAKNFQLNTPVPKDLLPILAKDEAKQNEIVKRAQEQAEKKKKVQSEQKTLSEPAAPLPKRQSESSASGNQAPKVVNQGANTAAAPSHPLSQRLEHNRRQHKMGTATGPPSMLPPQDGRQARQASYTSGMTPMVSPTKPGALRGPPSGLSTKLNPQVGEFRPNAMAMPFKPGSSVSGTTNVSSPSSHPATRTITPVTASGTGPLPPINLFREAKARDAKRDNRKPITWCIQTAKTIKPRNEDSKSDSKDTTPAKIQQPFKQRVDWIPASLEEDKLESLPKYKDQFVRDRMSRQPSFAGSAHGPQRGPHPGQYGGVNGGPNMHAVPMAGQLPPHMQGQHHHYPQGGHYDDHQMRPSQSGYSGYPGPSPRMHNAHPTPMPHGAQMGYPQGPYMNAGQGMPPRQFSNGPGGVPQMQPQMMMSQGPGPYMQQPMMPMQHHPQYPVHQGMYPGPPQSNGYPSPGRGAPAMMPSGSHQGHHQPYTPNGQYAQPYHPPPGQGMQRGNYSGQPNFPQSPYQNHASYPARTPSHGYAQPHQQPPVMTPQAPSAQPVSTGNDETK